MNILIPCFLLLLVLQWSVTASIVHHANNSDDDGDLSTARLDDGECYNDWGKLKADLEQGTVLASGDIIVVQICPNTTFYLDEKQNDHWIYLMNNDNYQSSQQQMHNNNKSNPLLILQCGAKGRLDDNCVIHGGLHHFWIQQGAQNIVMRGLTLENAKHGSIWHACCDNVQAKYEDCLWRDNHHVHLPTSNTLADGGGAAISGYNSDLSFHNCTFLVRLYTFTVQANTLLFNAYFS